MLVWLSLAILAQFFSALTVFIDKYVLVSKTGIQHPTAFAFYTAILSGFVLVLLLSVSCRGLLWNFRSSRSLRPCFTLPHSFFLYRALQDLSVSEVIPITAASGAVMTAILATVFLAQDLPLGLVPARIS